MGVPKRKTSKMRLRIRKAAHRKPAAKLRKDKKTGKRHLAHRVDPDTGTYRGRQVLTIKTEA
jgi:large subunit ribosomal protein L32